jgi:hypothetical protein
MPPLLDFGPLTEEFFKRSKEFTDATYEFGKSVGESVGKMWNKGVDAAKSMTPGMK